jgi:hypothetical protein
MNESLCPIFLLPSGMTLNDVGVLFLFYMNLQVLLFLVVVMAVLFLVKQYAKTYTMSVVEFRRLFNGMNGSRMIEVTTKGPYNETFTYLSYPIDVIECYDNKQNRVAIKNSPALEVQFTTKRGKRVSVYFDTIRINGTVITGSPSRFASKLETIVDLNEIEEIELRKVKKGFQYQRK